MEINKQLFEDVLDGRLKGTFVLRNKTLLNSNLLSKIAGSQYPYLLGNHSYMPDGLVISTCKTHPLNIVDFIPETNMKEKELKIAIPEGYCIDESKSTFEKIVFKKKDTKPRSWEEYCNNYTISGKEHYIGSDSNIYEINPARIGRKFIEGASASKNWANTKELAEAFLAMMQLMSLRQAWIGDWEPNYCMNMASNWCIEYEPNPGKFSIENHCRTNGGGLTFPTKEMAEDFMNTFKDLLNVAKPLI